ncbi:unnamed protein product, partial [Meganyctiphanes norvegica]
MIQGQNMMPRGVPPMPPQRAEESPPKILETNVDFPPLTVNGDIIKGPNGNNHNDHHTHHHHLLHHHHHCSADRLHDQDNMHMHHVHDLHHPSHDHDAETATPTDTMLTHPHKFPLPEDDDDDEGGMTNDTGVKAYDSNWKLQKVAHRHGLTKKGLVLLCLLGMLATFLLVVLLVLVAMWPREDHQDKIEVCLTPDCLRASAQDASEYIIKSTLLSKLWLYNFFFWAEEDTVSSIIRSPYTIQ